MEQASLERGTSANTNELRQQAISRRSIMLKRIQRLPVAAYTPRHTETGSAAIDNFIESLSPQGATNTHSLSEDLSRALRDHSLPINRETQTDNKCTKN